MIAALLNAADARARVAAGVGNDMVIRHHPSIEALLSTLEGGPVALVVIDAADTAGRSMSPVIASIRRGFPTIPVLAYCLLRGVPSSTIVDAVRAGATGIVLHDVDDTPHAVREAVRSAKQASISRRIHDEVARHLSLNARLLLGYAIARAADAPSVEDAAASLGVDRKTLLNWLRESGDVSPSEVIGWTRLAIAVGMLEDPGRTAERVALDLGYPSGVAFRNMLRRYTNKTSGQIRADGGLAHVLRLFVARLATERGARGGEDDEIQDGGSMRTASH